MTELLLVSKNELTHHGIKGMHWGVRNDRKPSYRSKKRDIAKNFKKEYRSIDKRYKTNLNNLNKERRSRNVGASGAARAANLKRFRAAKEREAGKWLDDYYKLSNHTSEAYVAAAQSSSTLDRGAYHATNTAAAMLITGLVYYGMEKI